MENFKERLLFNLNDSDIKIDDNLYSLLHSRYDALTAIGAPYKDHYVFKEYLETVERVNSIFVHQLKYWVLSNGQSANLNEKLNMHCLKDNKVNLDLVMVLKREFTPDFFQDQFYDHPDLYSKLAHVNSLLNLYVTSYTNNEVKLQYRIINKTNSSDSELLEKFPEGFNFEILNSVLKSKGCLGNDNNWYKQKELKKFITVVEFFNENILKKKLFAEELHEFVFLLGRKYSLRVNMESFLKSYGKNIDASLFNALKDAFDIY
jgi:hypothetical protein